MFPIHSHFGKIVGFSGRILPEFDNGKVGKYINSPDTPIYNKSRILYGFWNSKIPIRNKGEALLVEGQMDFLLSWQDDVDNVVATSGTALTADHLKVLRRVTNKIVMGFDKDEAGQMAIERSIDLAGAQDFTVRILSLDKFEDPADAVIKKPGFMKDAIKNAKTGMEYYFDRYLKPPAMESIEGKKVAIRTVLMKIKNLWSPVERSHWIGELSHRSGVKEDDLIEELEKLSLGVKEEVPATEKNHEDRKLNRRDAITEQILSLATGSDDYKKELSSYVYLISPNYKDAFGAIIGKSDKMTPDVEKIVNFITLQAGFLFTVISEDRLDAEFKNLLKELTMEYLKVERERIGAQISAAEKREDDEQAAKLLREFDDVLRKMQDIENVSQEVKETRR